MSQTQFVTLVNRSTKNLTGTWDGKQHTIVPGKHSFPAFMAQKFKEQNPVMGSANPQSEDPTTGRYQDMQYLIGIVEEGDDISPIEQSTSVEQWDRGKLIGARPSMIVQGDNGIYSRASVSERISIAAPDTKFVNDSKV